MLERENFIELTREYGQTEIVNIGSINRIEEYKHTKKFFIL